ncbi:MAG: toxic anion resistance protein, partial [Pseudomonadota bacterium]
MTEATRKQAEESKTMVDEVAAIVLPEPQTAIVPLQEADEEVSGEIRVRMGEIDMGDTNSIVSFGSRAQTELQEISQAMLADVRNKDVGPAGDSLRNIVTTIRGFSVSELDVRRERSWWEKLLGRAAP